MKTVKILVISVSTFFVLIIGLFLGYSIISQMKEAKEGKVNKYNRRSKN